jgi:hypothetical protein
LAGWVVIQLNPTSWEPVKSTQGVDSNKLVVGVSPARAAQAAKTHKTINFFMFLLVFDDFLAIFACFSLFCPKKPIC